MSKETIRVVAHIFALPEKAEEVKSILSGLVEPTRQEAGCIHYELLQSRTNPTEFTLLEEWETQAALDAHSAANFVKTAEAKMDSLLITSPPDVRFYMSIA